MKAVLVIYMIILIVIIILLVMLLNHHSINTTQHTTIYIYILLLTHVYSSCMCVTLFIVYCCVCLLRLLHQLVEVDTLMATLGPRHTLSSIAQSVVELDGRDVASE